MVILLLLLLLLLTCIHHSPLRQCDRLAQPVDVADVVGEDQHQCGVEIGALFVAQAAIFKVTAPEARPGPLRPRAYRQPKPLAQL